MLRSARVGLSAFVAVLTLVLVPTLTLGLAVQPDIVLRPPQLALEPGDPVGPEIPELPCTPFAGARGLVRISGIPLVGLTVTIRGDQLKLVNENAWCDSYVQPISDGEWSWAVTDRPAGSTAALVGTSSLTPTFAPDLPGEYEVTLTTCPDGCPFDDTNLTVPADDVVVRFETDDRLRPERRPGMPLSVTGASFCDLATNTCHESSLPCQTDFECSASSQPLFRQELVNIKCQDFLGTPAVVTPQWVTVQKFEGPQHYAGYHDGIVHAVEGFVSQGKISPMDNTFNHHSQDANWNVQLDPIYAHMKLSDNRYMHNEWESAELARSFQPSRMDRISMWGYLIHDCGHAPFKTEIHPPVGLAVHRERAVRIPDNWTSPLLPNASGEPSTAGSGVYVPGIVSDVWFNPDAGEMIEGDWTGLHNPAEFVEADCSPGNAGCVSFDGETGYIVDGDDIDELADLNAIFRFRVHLPRSPKAVLEDAGVPGLPDVPLYYEVLPGNIGVERVSIQAMTEDGTTGVEVTYLQVEVDLRGTLPSDKPWFRVAAAWVYPDSANWGLRRWRLSIDKLFVTDDGDGPFRGDGDWRLFVQLNNSQMESPVDGDGLPRHEWSKIIQGGVGPSCTFVGFPVGEICEDYTFSDHPWTTGGSDSGRDLGPDALLYPDQPLLFHVSGYEADWFGGDSLGRIENIHYQAGTFEEQNQCSSTFWEGVSPADTGCARFKMFYDLEDLGPVASPTLSPASLDLDAAFRLNAPCNDDVGCLPGPIVVDGAIAPPVEHDFRHPLEQVLPINDLGFSREETDLYKPRENEEYVTNARSVPDLKAVFAEFIENEPAEAAAYLAKLRQTFEDARAELGDEVLLDLQLFQMALPADLYDAYFGDVPPPEPTPGGTLRNIKGAANLGRGSDRTHINVHLHCDPLRKPQLLRVDWGDRQRFLLDLQLEVACDVDPDPMKTFAGRGLGSLNGEPGYRAEWTMVDEGNRDGLRIRIFAPDGELIHDVGSDRINGNLKAREVLQGRGPK